MISLTRKFTLKSILFSLSIVYLAISLSGCSANKYNLMNAYLDSSSTVNVGEYPFQYAEPTIKKYDLVRIKFAGMNPTTSALLNSYGGVQAETKLAASNGPEIEGQPVDKEGFLEFPLIGKIKAEGLTKAALRETLIMAVTPILKDPFVYVDLPKRGITILGEVKESKSVVFPKERANIFETLAQVGYVTDLADLTQVKVYREDASGSRQLGRLNLQDTTFLTSAYFYPQPDDVIFVPARKEKWFRSFGESYLQYVSIIFIISTLVVSIVNN